MLAVAGTHGKSTTSSMLAWILEDAGLEPGLPHRRRGAQLRHHRARHRSSPFFVIEADEYDTAFFDKRSKFVWYRPRTAVLANLEYDHADIFPDLAAIETQFHHLVRIVPAQGLLVVNGHAGGARARARARRLDAGRALRRRASRGAWARSTPTIRSTCCSTARSRARCAGSLMGDHNRQNALAALAAARHAGVPVARGDRVARRASRA